MPATEIVTPNGTKYSIRIAPRGMPYVETRGTWALGWLVHMLLPGDQWKVWVTIFHPGKNFFGKVATYDHEVRVYGGYDSRSDAVSAAERIASEIQQGTWNQTTNQAGM